MNEAVRAVLKQQRDFFRTHKTKPIEFREAQLRALRDAIRESEQAVYAAVQSDLGKCAEEAFLGEIGLVYEEIGFALKNLRRWMRPEWVPTPLLSAIGRSQIHRDPLGVVLIIGPWNYPFQLLAAPLVAALAAGNCAVLKPSELAPATSKIVAKLVKETFEPEVVTVMEGGVDLSTALLAEKWDHIFFTGGTAIGKVVMTAAAKHLTPVTLELGGKSPCIVDNATDLAVTARRITWGKFFNAGQTCVAPDYLMVPKALKEPLLHEMKASLATFFGEDPGQSRDYARIVNDRHFHRLVDMLPLGKHVFGGRSRTEDRYIAPTALEGVPLESKLMEEEIFGPLLPILEYDNIGEAIEFVNARPKPLALYFFSRDRENQDRVLRETSFGGGCLNDTLVHLSNPRLPFGGVGESGLGAYHGKYGFDAFSHKKSVVKKAFFPDPNLRYPPYEGRLGLFRRLMR